MESFRTESVELQSPAAWARLLEEVRTGSAGDALRALPPLRSELDQLGQPGFLIDAITTGLTTSNWSDAAEAFGRMVDAPWNFYLGPMRSSEGAARRTGVVLMSTDPAAAEMSALIEACSEELVSRTFGDDLPVGTRHVECYALKLAAGPFESGRAISLFTPFYLIDRPDEGWHEGRRRTIIFVNLLAHRFAALTTPVAARHMVIDDRAPRFATVSPAEIGSALAMWAALHELMHGAGPLPLFGAPVSKIALGLSYAGFEEMRVDMTVWRLLWECADLFGPLAALTREVLLCERLARSARLGLRWCAPEWRIRSGSDAEQGLLWLSLLLDAGAVEVDDAVMHVDSSAVKACVESELRGIYHVEMAAAADPSSGPGMLIDYAASVRRRCFGRADWRFEGNPGVTRWQTLTCAAAREYALAFTIKEAARSAAPEG